MKLDLIKKYGVSDKKVLQYIINKPIIDSEPVAPLDNHNSPFRILVVGRLVKQKNVDKIIYVFKRFSEIETNSELIILGDGDDGPYLEHLTDGLRLNNSVKFLGLLKTCILLSTVRFIHLFFVLGRLA